MNIEEKWISGTVTDGQKITVLAQKSIIPFLLYGRWEYIGETYTDSKGNYDFKIPEEYLKCGVKLKIMVENIESTIKIIKQYKGKAKMTHKHPDHPYYHPIDRKHRK